MIKWANLTNENKVMYLGNIELFLQSMLNWGSKLNEDLTRSGERDEEKNSEITFLQKYRTVQHLVRSRKKKTFAGRIILRLAFHFNKLICGLIIDGISFKRA